MRVLLVIACVALAGAVPLGSVAPTNGTVVAETAPPILSTSSPQAAQWNCNMYPTFWGKLLSLRFERPALPIRFGGVEYCAGCLIPGKDAVSVYAEASNATHVCGAVIPLYDHSAQYELQIQSEEAIDNEVFRSAMAAMAGLALPGQILLITKAVESHAVDAGEGAGARSEVEQKSFGVRFHTVGAPSENTPLYYISTFTFALSAHPSDTVALADSTEHFEKMVINCIDGKSGAVCPLGWTMMGLKKDGEQVAGDSGGMGLMMYSIYGSIVLLVALFLLVLSVKFRAQVGAFLFAAFCCILAARRAREAEAAAAAAAAAASKKVKRVKSGLKKEPQVNASVSISASATATV